MKKTFTIAFMLMTFAVSTKAYENIKSRIDITTKQGYSINNLRFGLHSLATTSLDTALGELEAPPFKPPEGINAAYEIFDSTQMQKIWTYMDLRPFPTKPYDTVFHYLKILKGNGDLCTLSWNPLFPEILSAILVDALTDGKLININMKDSVKAFINNEFLESFILKVVYDPPTGIIEDKVYNYDEVLSAHLSSDGNSLNIESDYCLGNYELYSIWGICLTKGNLESNKETIIINNLPQGIYFLRVRDFQGKFHLIKVVKN